jgi:hypothetical protein
MMINFQRLNAPHINLGNLLKFTLVSHLSSIVTNCFQINLFIYNVNHKFISFTLIMSNKHNKNQEYLANSMWQRNLCKAREINVDLNAVFDDSFKILLDLLNSYKMINDTDPVGLLLSLFTCVGHLCGNSTINIRNHITNLNIFLLLIGPSGMIVKNKIKNIHISYF